MLYFFVIFFTENKKWGRATAGLVLLSMTVPRLSHTVPKGSDVTVITSYAAWSLPPDPIRNQIE